MAQRAGTECPVDRSPVYRAGPSSTPAPYSYTLHPGETSGSAPRLPPFLPQASGHWPGLATCRPLYLGPWQFLDWKRKERTSPEIALGLSRGPQTGRRSQWGTSHPGTQLSPSWPRDPGMEDSHEWAERGRIRTLLTMAAAEE